MGKVNPIKQFNWTIEIDGLDQFVAQECTLPDRTIDEAEHTEGNFVVRTPGLVRLGDLSLSNLKPSEVADNWAQDWFTSVQDLEEGTGQIPQLYNRNIVVRLRDNQGNTVQQYEYKDCWIKQITGLTLSKTTSDNILEEVVITVNGLEQN